YQRRSHVWSSLRLVTNCICPRKRTATAKLYAIDSGSSRDVPTSIVGRSIHTSAWVEMNSPLSTAIAATECLSLSRHSPAVRKKFTDLAMMKRWMKIESADTSHMLFASERQNAVEESYYS